MGMAGGGKGERGGVVATVFSYIRLTLPAS